MIENKFSYRTQFSPRLDVGQWNFPPSDVQPGMSPSISQMVRTRSVGGNLDEYQMDGIAEDAPFDSEYIDFFDVQDMAQTGVERQTPTQSSAQSQEPQNVSSGNDQGSTENAETK